MGCHHHDRVADLGGVAVDDAGDGYVVDPAGPHRGVAGHLGGDALGVAAEAVVASVPVGLSVEQVQFGADFVSEEATFSDGTVGQGVLIDGYDHMFVPPPRLDGLHGDPPGWCCRS